MAIYSNPPKGYHSINAFQVVRGAERLIAFAESVFGAKKLEYLTRPDGSIGHAELGIGDSLLMISEASDEWPAMPAALYVYVADCDATFAKGLSAGGISIAEPKTQFYGDRHAAVLGPCGELWWIATRVETLSTQDIQERAKAAMAEL